LNETDPQSRPIPVVPKEAAAILESTFQRILAEATFADAWPLADVPEDEAMSSTELKIQLPLHSPWKGTVLVGATEATAKDLAAGFHSLPDTMVDRALASEFLAEIAEMLARDIFCASDVSVVAGTPSVPSPERAGELWKLSNGSRTVQGCNGTGRVIAALVAASE
jgi:hypothetical protein